VELLHTAVDLFLHIDRHLNEWAALLGAWTYVLLFAIIFCETGLVVTPFLPGDSLLFAVGALAATPGTPISLSAVWLLLSVAAVLGDAVNYAIGARVGPAVFSSPDSRWLNKEHLRRTHRFYEKHGGKTIVIARFLPIIRTFAPFVAGIGRMGYARFAAYNVFGGLLWVTLFLSAGYKFAGLPMVQKNFHYVILALVILPGIPALIEFIRALRAPKNA
jgi:membrane-associated protein